MSPKLVPSPTAGSAASFAGSPRALRVLHIGKFYPPHMGGIETHLEALSGELRKTLDLRVIVASDGSHSGEHVLDGVPVVRVATPVTLFSTPICPNLVPHIRRAGADIVHIHLPNPMAVVAYLASGHRGPLVITYHSDTVRQKFLGLLFEPLLHSALGRSSAIIATSPNYLETSRILSRYRHKCHVIPYGVDTARFRNPAPQAVARIRRQYGERLIVSVGRLVYYKGFEHLIRAMDRVPGKLLIIGDGPLRAQLQNLASRLGIAGKVVFVGEVTNAETAPYYQAADVFVLASVARSEAFGIVQIEAMAAGLPVVNTRLDSGVPYVSLDGQTGFTVAPADPAALASAINRLLDDPPLRNSFGLAGMRRAQEEFSLERMAERTLRLYETVIDTSNIPCRPCQPA